MTQTYWVSKTVVVEWQIADPDGNPVTTAAVAATITLPNGTTVAASVTHTAGSDVYRALYDPTVAGTHAYRLVATGAADGAEEGTFDVQPSPNVAPAPTMDPSTDIGMIRLLIPDRDPDNLLFADRDLAALLVLEGNAVKRATASALELVANNESMVSKVIKTQDLQTDGTKVAADLRAQAAELRRQANEDDDATAGGLDIIDFRPPFNRRWSGEGAEPEWSC